MSCLTSWSAILIFAFSKDGGPNDPRALLPKPNPSFGIPESVRVQLAIFIFVMDHAERVIPGLQVFENYRDILTCRFNNPFFDGVF